MPFAAEGRCPKPPFSVASEPLFGETESQVAFVSACICAALGTLGNSLTFAVLIFNPSIRRHPTTPFLFSLAFSDLIMSTLTLPLMAMRWDGKRLFYFLSTTIYAFLAKKSFVQKHTEVMEHDIIVSFIQTKLLELRKKHLKYFVRSMALESILRYDGKLHKYLRMLVN